MGKIDLGKHNINSIIEHGGVAGAVEDNITSFDANGLPKDAGVASDNVRYSTFIETTPPLKGNDNTEGFEVGSIWIDITHKQIFTCIDTTTDDARWTFPNGEFVVNKTGVLITKSSVVYQNGAQGGTPTIALADSDTEPTSSGTWGFVMTDIPINGFGYIVNRGAASNFPVPTATYSDGDALWLSSTAGGFTNVKPDTPQHLVFLGHVDLAHNTEGVINVKIVNGYELGELHDYLVTSVSTGDYIKYTGSYYENSSFDTDVSAISVLRSEWLQNGFVDKDDVTLTWSDSTPDRTLTIAPAVTSFDYFLDGIKTTISSSDTFQIAATEGLHAIYYNDNAGTIAEVINPTKEQIDSIILNESTIAYVYWDNTNSDGRLMSELHGHRMNPATHHYLHDRNGSFWESGLALGDILSDQTGALDSHAQFSNTSGEIYDEDLDHDVLATTSTTGLEIWYLNGSDWRWTTNAGFSVLTTGTGRLAYNNSGAQTEVGNTNFVLCHVFATNVKTDAGADVAPIAIQGQNEYSNITTARDGALTEITNLITGTLPISELVPMATLIFQTSNAYGNSVKGRIRTTDAGEDYLDWRTTAITPSGAAQDHGNLSGLNENHHPGYAWLAGRSGGQTLSGSDTTAEDLTLKDNTVDGNTVTVTELRAPLKGTISAIFDGGGAAITAGAKNYNKQMPCAGTITTARLVSMVSGVKTDKSIQIEVYVNGGKISASAPMTLSAESESNDSTLTGWTKGVSAGDEITFTVIGTPDAEYVDAEISYDKTGV